MFSEITSRSIKFYTVLKQLFIPEINTHISNNSRIPNSIRNSDREVELWISEVEPSATIQLSDFCQYRNKGSMYLHILQNSVHNKVQKIYFKEHTSLQLSEMAFNIELSVENTGSMIAIEWQKPYSKYVNPKIMKDSFQIENPQIELTDDMVDKKKSFVQKKLSRSEMKKASVILSSKFSRKDSSNGTKALLAITILNLDQEILYNTLVTPRRRVRDFDTENHGITEIDSHGHADEYKAIADAQAILKGKIVVGYEVVDQLENLCINICQVLGIRELSTALAIERPKNFAITEDIYIRFSDLLEKFKINLKKNQVLTFSEAEAICKIYYQIGDKWVDHIYPKNGLEKESSNTLKMTILKDENRAQKPEYGNSWKTQYKESPKRRHVENPKSAPCKVVPDRETSRWDLEPSPNKEKTNNKQESRFFEKYTKVGCKNQTEKRLRIEDNTSKPESSNISSLKNATFIEKMASKIPCNNVCFKGENFSANFSTEVDKTNGYAETVDLDDNDSDIQFVKETRNAFEIAEKFANSVEMHGGSKIDKATNTEDELNQTWIFQGHACKMIQSKWEYRNDVGKLVTLEIRFDGN